MPEKLDAFKARTAYMDEKLTDWGCFETAPGLAQKVDERGAFRAFYGNTTVFMLGEPEISWLSGVQDRLYASCGDCLAERILPDTFHITLHDLLSSTEYPAIAQQVETTGARALALLEAFGKTEPQRIALRARGMFSMARTSVVMGFEPAAQQDCDALTGMYDALNQVVPLPYPLTPHVTLAYYRNGYFGQERIERLQAAFDREAAWRGREVVLTQDRLFCSLFFSMNDYRLQK